MMKLKSGKNKPNYRNFPQRFLFFFCCITLAGLLFFVSSCEKQDPISSGPSTPGSGPFFSWSLDGGSTIVANSAYFIANYNNIVGAKAGNTSSVDMILDNFEEGKHYISGSTGVSFEYLSQGTVYEGKSGVITITSNLNGLISGNFNATLSGGSVTNITGNFSNLEEK